MSDAEFHELLEGKGESARIQIARRVGDRLMLEDLPDAECRAAEALARSLLNDAIERVRQELSKAVRHARYLPRDIALKIAHDVDSVACPFLEVTEVFSDAEWQRLVLTISRGARIAVAWRTSMTEGLALALAELGDSLVAESLVANTDAPATVTVCDALIERFETSTWVLDKLAERDGLNEAIAVKLYAKISAAARQKLSETYGLADYTEPIGFDAEFAAILQLVRDTPEPRLSKLVGNIHNEGNLSHPLLLRALRDGLLAFFEAAVSHFSGLALTKVRSAVRHGGLGPVTELFDQAGIRRTMHGEYWHALQSARIKAHASEPAT